MVKCLCNTCGLYDFEIAHTPDRSVKYSANFRHADLRQYRTEKLDGIALYNVADYNPIASTLKRMASAWNFIVSTLSIDTHRTT